MVSRSLRWLGLLPALLLPALGLWPHAAFSERSPQAAAVAPAAAQDDPNQARVIVKFRSGSTLARSAGAGGRAQHAGRLGSRLALPLTDGRPLGPHTQGLRGHGLSSRQLAARLAAQPDVEWAVVDERRYITALPNDPYYGAGQASITPTVGQWYLRKPDSTLVAAINAESAWDLSTGSAAITVAVLDTGVRFDHPDLQGKLWPGYDFVSRDTNARDGDGRDADPSDPGDWSLASDTCGASDSSWHGTQVAGLIGANTGNGLGMASVGRQVMVLPVRVLGKCGGFDSDIQAAMLWAAGLSSDPVGNPHPAQVINLSLGSSGSCTQSYQTVLAQLTAARVTVVVAAGNTTGLAVNSPANCSDAIAVAGLRHAGSKVGYSSLGPQVSVAAPAGNCVNETGECLYPLLTTDNSGSTSPGANVYSDSFKASLGTSFASPLVAGTVGLMLAVDPTLTPARIKSILKATARAFPTTGAQTDGAVACHAPTTTQQVECYCTTSTCGAGMLDAGAAVASVAASALPPAAVFSISPSNVTAGSAVTLDAGGSTVSGGRTLAAYRWSVTSGVAFAALSGATDGRTATLTTLAAGAVQVMLTVTDSTGASSSTTKSIDVVAAPSVVIAASNSNPTVGSSVTFDGGGSTVGASRTLSTYSWAITSGAQLATFSGATNGRAVILTSSGAGAVSVSLTVTDSAGASRTSTSTISVIAAPSAVIAAPNSNPTAGSVVTLDGGGSTVGAGRTLSTYSWAITSGAQLATLSGAMNGRVATLTLNGAGAVTVSLTVTDSAGASRTSTVAISVIAAPIALIAASDSNPTVGSAVTFDGAGSTVGAGRTLSAYGWAITSGAQFATFSGATNGRAVTLTSSGAGTVMVSLTVTDSAGASRTSTATISVIAAPSAVIAASNSNPTVGSVVTLDGGGSTVGDGRTLSAYSWAIASGAQLATLSGAVTGRTVTLTSTGAGAVGVSLTVTDNAGTSRTSVTTVQVAALPIPVVKITNDSPSIGASVVLDAGDSTVGVMRTVSSYRWQIVAGSDFANFVGATDGRTATLATSAAGAVQVSLTVTDSSGASFSTTQSIAVVAAPTAVITASSTTPTVGSNISLDGVGSSASTGRTLAAYQWAITNGANAASFVGATNVQSTTLAASAAGAVVVSLTVTDSDGTSRSSSLTINVAAPIPTPASSGGGALGGGWLWGLAAAVLALRRPRRP